MKVILDKCEEIDEAHNIMFSTDPDPAKSKFTLFIVWTKEDWPNLSLSPSGHELNEADSMEQICGCQGASNLDKLPKSYFGSNLKPTRAFVVLLF